MSIVSQINIPGVGLKISPVIVGCMIFGRRDWFPWRIDDEDKIFKILKYCYDKGLRTYDLADTYSQGYCEALIGKFLKKFNINRETVVIMTKIFFPIDESLNFNEFNVPKGSELDITLTNQRGLSRKHILAGAKSSMERLGTYIDILQIHRLDHGTSFKEIMRSLNDVVNLGYTRYIGASTMLATEFAELKMLADKYNWFQFINVQTQYNLLYREDERELVPFLKRHNIIRTPWAPNARGALTRPVGELTLRAENDSKITNLTMEDKEIIQRVEKIAKKRNVSMATISTSWVINKSCHPIVGFNSIERVDAALEAINLKLTDDEIRYLEKPYKPKPYHFINEF